MVIRRTGAIGPGQVGSPAPGRERPQTRRDRHFAKSQRQRYEHLAFGVLAKRWGVLRHHADRMTSLLG